MYELIQCFILKIFTPQSKQSWAPEKWRHFLETPPKKLHEYAFFLNVFTYTSHSWCKSFRKYQNVGCFFKMVKILHFCYFITQLVKSYGKGLYMRWQRISCHSFWIQNGLWAIFGCWAMNKTVLGVFFEKICILIFFKNTDRLLGKGFVP